MDRPWVPAGLKWAWIKRNDPDCLLVQRVARLRGDRDLNQEFLRYIIGSPQFEDYIIPITTGVNIPHISGQQISEFKFPLPPLPTQQKIAAILSTYDDLIENNTRRIKILEEMAQAIYREWFVHFRFPGHEGVRMVESELGLIPEGWELTNLGSVTENFDRKRKPLSSLQREKRKGEYPYYGAAKIFDYIDDYLFDGYYLLIAEDGSVITTDNRPVLQLVNGKFWANNHTHIIQGKSPFSIEYLYLRLKDLDVSGYITGAAQPKINQENLNRIPMLSPQNEVLLLFNSYIEEYFKQIFLLEKKNAKLRRTRDLLLPKLISGEIDVSEKDIKIPEAEA